MADASLEGPWPRTLTFAEIETMKAQAMLVLEDKLCKMLELGEMNCGDAFTVTYTLSCGSNAELEALKKTECGTVPSTGGPACRLQKGHTCDHSSVFRWPTNPKSG